MLLALTAEEGGLQPPVKAGLKFRGFRVCVRTQWDPIHAACTRRRRGRLQPPVKAALKFLGFSPGYPKVNLNTAHFRKSKHHPGQYPSAAGAK
jgi:hypothetical protein